MSLDLVHRIKAKAAELGFDLCGIAPATRTAHEDYVRRWLASGQAGTMTWLLDRANERVDPETYLPGVRTAVCVAINYHSDLAETPEADRPYHGRIARYALGDDYHQAIKPRLYDLADWLRDTVPGTRTKCGVDTVPVLERELAGRSGIGWVGKNTLLINPRVGSWLLLGEVLTTLDLPPDEPMADHCGTCTRCLDACPTQAFPEPYKLDASRCISYLTIEHREDDIPPELAERMGGWLYGCDICQDVCPHNRKVPSARDPIFRPRFPTGSLDARQVVNWTVDDFRAVFRHSAVKRIKLPQLQRNARIVLANQQRDAGA